jgi:hypothetical protein
MIDQNDKKRLAKVWYSIGQRAKGKRKFKKDEFIVWYLENSTDGCHYCGLSTEDCRALVIKLPSSRFPTSNKPERGRSRGLYLEVDRKKPKEEYSKDNCVLSCYFCNNDKSDVFTYSQYMEMLHGVDWMSFSQENKRENPRYKFLIKLLS